MKRFNLFLLIGLLVGATIFTGCKKDDDEPIIGFPTIDFKGGEGFTFENVTIKTHDQIKVGIMAAMHAETKEALTNFKLTLGTSTLIDSTFSANTFDADYIISFMKVSPGEYKLNARITDASGRSDEASFTITVELGGVKVKKNDDIFMGSFNDPAGSFYSTIEETVYRVAEAKERQDKIDFIFFRGATNLNTFAAPDDEAVNTISDFQLNEWTTKNQTRFARTTMAAADFDAIGEYYIFPEFTGTLTRVNELNNGEVVYFKTQAGKRGYIKVIDLYNRGDVAKLEVIVEE
jgi:hypothetical protein